MAIGQSKQRLDAEAKVTGRARYTDDMGLPGMRHAAYVHSTIAHGMVLSIDASEALALPGVEAVFTADDVPGFLFPTAGHPYSMDPSHGDVADRLLLTKHVRYYGDEVAVVVAGAGQGGTTGHEHQRGKHGDMTEQRVKQRERHDGFRLGAWAIVTMRRRADSLRRITMSVGRWPISPVAPAPRYCRQQRQFASAPSPGA